jgi:hypothetical protein
VQQLMTFALFSLLVLLLCLVRPGAGRIFMGIFFLVMAIGVNVVLVLVAPNLFGMCPVKCVNRLCAVPSFLPRHQLRLLHQFLPSL